MESVRYVHRPTGEILEEVIYGEGWLRRLYTTRLGRALLRLVRAPLFSRFYGWLQDRPSSRRKIPDFVAQLGLDPDESEMRPEEYATFNDYFSRRLKPERRPLAPDAHALVSPADCRLMLYPELSGNTVIPAKGVPYTLDALLGDAAQAARFRGGSCVSLRLCPSDYHRFHFPCGGVTGETRELGDVLYSVSPIALSTGLSIFTDNHRVVVPLDGTTCGDLVIVIVGATCVGTIVYEHTPGQSFARGDEMGHFRFGGSNLLLLVPPDRVRWDADLVATAREGIETRVEFGERIGLMLRGY